MRVKYHGSLIDECSIESRGFQLRSQVTKVLRIDHSKELWNNCKTGSEHGFKNRVVLKCGLSPTGQKIIITLLKYRKYLLQLLKYSNVTKKTNYN